MKSACKNTESGIAFWVICSNWFSCTNLNPLQTALLSVGRILTAGEEQPRSSARLAGKAHLSPEEAPRPSPGRTRRGRAVAAALPRGSGPRSPRMALEPAKPEGSEGKSGLRSHPCPPPHLRSLAWGILLCLQLGGASQLPGAVRHLGTSRVLFFFPLSLPQHLPLTTPPSYLRLLFLVLRLSAVPLWPLASKGRHEHWFCEQKFSSGHH